MKVLLSEDHDMIDAFPSEPGVQNVNYMPPASKPLELATT
jgi:hypothetical protein